MLKHYLLALLLAISFRPAVAAVFYVAPTGSDANSGTIQNPFFTIQRAQTAVVAGDTVYIRGGTYLMQNSQIAGYLSPYAYVTLLNKSGSATAGRINYWAYPGEQPVFNYANVDPNVTNAGAPFAAPYRISAFEVTGAYIYLRGLEIVGVRVPTVASNVNTLSICFSQSGAGGNNIYERLSMHDGQAIGFYLTRGLNNLILNCDAYRNNDNVNTTNSTGTAGGGNVDGFGCHPNNANYTGNVFRGCRAWQNSDDGYDCISAFAATTFENCWAFYNGYTQNFVSRGDGNGFKAGGYGSTAYASLPAVIPSNTVRFCTSVRNKSNGFYSNHHLQGSTWLNNTAYQNGVNFDMLNRKARNATDYLTDVPGYNHTLRNNISLLARSANSATRDLADVDASACTIDHNAFPLNGITATPSDFISLDTTLLRSPRQADGGLPIIPTLRLATGSSLIDAGIDVGFPYSGAAPDLGAYEFANLWTGTVSTDWFTSANWSGGVPTATTDALISGSAPFQPIITSGAAAARTLTIGSGATLTMAGGTLDAQGDWQNSGTFTASGGMVILGTTAATNGPNILGSRTRFWNLTVNANGVLLSTAAGASVQRVLTLNGVLMTQGNSFTLESNSTGTALVVNNGTGVVSGNATVQRYIDGSLNGGLGYHHYSSPVAPSTVSDLATAGFTPVVNPAYNTSAMPGTVTPFPTVYAYDQSRLASTTNNSPAFDKGFVSPAALTEVLQPGQGYAVNIGASQVIDFVGTLNNSDGYVSLARNSGSTAADAGWALLGNPYPAPLDYSRVTPGERPGLDAAIYVYQSTGQYVGQYRAYANGVGGNPILPVAQGFFARVSAGQTSGTLLFRNSQRLTTADATPFQRTTADLRPQVQLELRGSTGPADAFYAYAEAGATPAFDSQYDATKLPNPNGLNLASVAGSESLAIDGRAAFTAATVIPLAVGVPAAGTYSLSTAALDNVPTGLEAYLHDSQTGQTVPLTVGTPYPFNVTASQAAAIIAGRFTLQFSPATALATTASLSPAEVTIYPNPAHERFTVAVPAVAAAPSVQAELLNTLGQVVRRQSATLPATGAILTVETAGLATGVYVLRLQAGGNTLTKRVLVQ